MNHVEEAMFLIEEAAKLLRNNITPDAKVSIVIHNAPPELLAKAEEAGGGYKGMVDFVGGDGCRVTLFGRGMVPPARYSTPELAEGSGAKPKVVVPRPQDEASYHRLWREYRAALERGDRQEAIRLRHDLNRLYPSLVVRDWMTDLGEGES